MLTKSFIIILAVAFVGSFLVFFLVTWLTSPDPQAGATELAQSAEADALQAEVEVAQLPGDQIILQLKESQLDELATELRMRVLELEKREERIVEQENRLQLAEKILAKRADALAELSAQLVAPIEVLKNTLDELRKTRIVIARNEVAGLQRAAATYDKMASDASSKILAEMCSGNGIDKVVKILNYMSERNVANLLAEMTDKSLAAKLTAKMLTIQTES